MFTMASFEAGVIAVVSGAAAAGATAAATAQRVQVGGVVVLIDASSFMKILSRLKNKDVMVIHGKTGILSKTHVYLIPYQGIVFITKTKDPLPITPDIEAKQLGLPPLMQ